MIVYTDNLLFGTVAKKLIDREFISLSNKFHMIMIYFHPAHEND